MLFNRFVDSWIVSVVILFYLLIELLYALVIGGLSAVVMGVIAASFSNDSGRDIIDTRVVMIVVGASMVAVYFLPSLRLVLKNLSSIWLGWLRLYRARTKSKSICS